MPNIVLDRKAPSTHDYSIDWTPLLAGLLPAGMAARLAARHTFSVRGPAAISVSFRRDFCRADDAIGMPLGDREPTSALGALERVTGI
jgi:hypothetical protein